MALITYLDNNATTRVDPAVLDSMMPFFTEHYGNPSSIHDFGERVSGQIEKARSRVRELLGAGHENEIYFTSGGTESNNTAITGVLSYRHSKRHLITTSVEHSSVLNVCRSYEEKGYRVTYVPVDSDGRLDLEYLKKAVDEDTAIVSIMHANNETGVIHPVEDIGRFLRERGVPFHVDGIQAAGKIPVNVNEIPCDLYSISGHKLHAAKGIGALYIREGTRMNPLMSGGDQERSIRPGTENVPGIVGLGKAAELALKHFGDARHIAQLRDRLELWITRQFPNAVVNGMRSPRVPNTTNIGFRYLERESILLQLNEHGVAASSGSACSSDSHEPSHVLKAMGLPFTSINGSIRFSLSRFTTEEDIGITIDVLHGVINRLLENSSFRDIAKPYGF